MNSSKVAETGVVIGVGVGHDDAGKRESGVVDRSVYEGRVRDREHAVDDDQPVAPVH